MGTRLSLANSVSMSLSVAVSLSQSPLGLIPCLSLSVSVFICLCLYLSVTVCFSVPVCCSVSLPLCILCLSVILILNLQPLHPSEVSLFGCLCVCLKILQWLLLIPLPQKESLVCCLCTDKFSASLSVCRLLPGGPPVAASRGLQRLGGLEGTPGAVAAAAVSG